jgi:hypothetical protein
MSVAFFLSGKHAAWLGGGVLLHNSGDLLLSLIVVISFVIVVLLFLGVVLAGLSQPVASTTSG